MSYLGLCCDTDLWRLLVAIRADADNLNSQKTRVRYSRRGVASMQIATLAPAPMPSALRNAFREPRENREKIVDGIHVTDG